jgi:hypothetical protein
MSVFFLLLLSAVLTVLPFLAEPCDGTNRRVGGKMACCKVRGDSTQIETLLRSLKFKLKTAPP